MLLALGGFAEARAWLLGLGSLMLFAMVYWLAFALRFDFRIPPEWFSVLLATAPWVLGIKLAVFYATGQCHGWWLHVTFSDLKALLGAALLSLGWWWRSTISSFRSRFPARSCSWIA